MSDVVVVATLTPQPGKTQELEAALSSLIEQVHAAEPGCLLYALHRHPDGERLVMIEKYTGTEAQKEHRASAHFKAAGGVMAGLLAGPPDVLSMEPVPLGDPSKGRL